MALNGVIGVLPDGVYSSLNMNSLCISLSAARMSLQQKFQLGTNSVTNWSNMSRFRFFASKTVTIHFCRKGGVHVNPDLYLGNRRLSCVETALYFDLLFDS